MNNTKRTGIGASDVVDVLSLPPYGCKLRLWRERQGQEPDYPQTVNEHMRRGIFFEDFVAGLYKKQTGRELARLKKKDFPIIHKDYPFVRCIPDRLHKKDGSPLEIKCPSRRVFMQLKMNGLQEAYILQIQQQINLCNAEKGSVAIFCAETADFLTWDVPRDEAMFKEILRAEISFWGLVEKKIEPEKLPCEDKRCGRCDYRITCHGNLLSQQLLEHIHSEGNPALTVDTTFEPLVNQYQEAKAIMDEAAEYLAEVQDKVKQAMGDRQAVQTYRARIYFRPQESWRWDTKLLASKYPELEKEFKKKITTRPLRIYGI